MAAEKPRQTGGTGRGFYGSYGGLRAIARELAMRGFVNERGKPYAAKSVGSMLR